MPIMNKVKTGSDLTKPTPSIGWLVGGIVSVIMLLLAVSISMLLFTKATAFTGQKAGENSVISRVAAYGSGYD